MFAVDVIVVGGAGHVGLPLAIAFASRGLRVVIQDIDPVAVAKIQAGEMPFREEGAADMLRRVLDEGLLSASTDPALIGQGESVVVVVGTPVDGHLNPDAHAVPLAVAAGHPHLVDGQLLVLRSTVYPGVTRRVERMLEDEGLAVDVAFCPERIVEGQAMTELFALPQIVSARTDEARARAAKLFGALTETIVDLEPEEAELAKLFTNTWRYIKFAAANQFFIMANDAGLDYERIRSGLRQDYPRAADLPGAGFAAGPCLFKDTMQLAAFTDNRFHLGHSAMLVNEGLPLYVVSRLERKYRLENLTVGILGMAFKAESDDVRSSLSYKLKRILEFRARRVLCTDPYVTVDQTLTPLHDVVAQADLLIIGAPHQEYADLRTEVEIIDVWNLRNQGSVV